MSFGNFDYFNRQGHFVSMFGDSDNDDFMDDDPPYPFPIDNKWNNHNYSTTINGKTWKFTNMDFETYAYVIRQEARGVPIWKIYAEVYPNSDNNPKPVAPIPDPVGPKPDSVPETDGEKPDEVGEDTLDKEDPQNIKEHMDPDCDFDDSTFKSNNQ